MDVECESKQKRILPEAFKLRHMPVLEMPLPAENEVHLWYLHLGQLGGTLQRALGGDPQAAEEQHPGARQLRLLRRFYLRLLLGAYLGLAGKDVVVNRSNRGKPVLDTSVHDVSLHFSMAKSEDRLLIGISTTCPLGVDLEPSSRRARSALRLAERYFSADEFAALKALGPQRLDEAFLRAWSCNEAVVKASGLGIANQLCRFTLEMNPDLPPRVLAMDDDEAEAWSLALVNPTDDFVGAVAARQPELNISCYQLMPVQ